MDMLLPPGGVECEHCFHDSKVALLTHPPKYQQRCCWCGHTKYIVKRLKRDNDKQHGGFVDGTD